MTVDAEILAKLKNMLDIGKLWRTCQTLCQHRLQNISISAPSVVPHSGASCASCADTSGPFCSIQLKGSDKEEKLTLSLHRICDECPLDSAKHVAPPKTTKLGKTACFSAQNSWNRKYPKAKHCLKKTRFALLCMWCFFAFITEKGWLVFHPLKHLGMMSSNHPCHVAPPKKELNWAFMGKQFVSSRLLKKAGPNSQLLVEIQRIPKVWFF